MMFDEAVSMCKRIESYTVGALVKGMKIEYLCVGPTEWEYMNDFINLKIQMGREEAVRAFSNRSFSVYGVAVDKEAKLPRHTMIVLDQYEKMVCN